MEVMLYNGENSYIVKKDDMHYLVNLDVPAGFVKSEYVESFLKFGGDWERVETVEPEISKLLEKRIANNSK